MCQYAFYDYANVNRVVKTSALELIREVKGTFMALEMGVKVELRRHCRKIHFTIFCKYSTRLKKKLNDACFSL